MKPVTSHNPQPPGERGAARRTASFYEQEAERYDRLRWDNPVGRYIDEAQRAIILDACDFRGKHVVELGAGSGRFTALLAAHGAYVTAVDLSPNMLQVAREKLAARGLGNRVRLVGASADSLPLADSSFHGALCINVFSHLQPFRAAISEIGRVLAPGAGFVANFPNLLSLYLPAGAFVNCTGRSLFRDVYTHWYTWGEIERAYGAADLDIERVIGHVYLPRRVKAAWAVAPLRLLDGAMRHSRLQRFAPVVFVVARRM
jgi:ubiquinone/menaquinone biosynthesis C-methylase UbiE